MGLEEAEVTQASGDGGIDVIAEGAVAQVKLYTSPIPVADVREFAGVALTNHRSEIPLFFASNEYSSGAADFGTQAGLALFFFDPAQGKVEPRNEAAEEIITNGLGEQMRAQKPNLHS